MSPALLLPRVLLLTDAAQLGRGQSLAALLHDCVTAMGHAVAVVIREFDAPDATRQALVDAVNAAHGIALAARRPLQRTAGIHLASAQDRATAPAGKPWGRSCHSRADATRAADEGASWVTISPVAPSASKPGYGPPVAAAGVSHVADSVPELPVFALGGVTPANAAQWRAAGAYGVAVMGEVMRASQPTHCLHAICEAVAL